MAETTVSKEVEFDAGHRVPDHNSKCFSPHGHRYRVRVTCRGEVVDEAGASDNGMVVDFGDLKLWMMAYIHDVFDHSMIVYDLDEELSAAMRMPDVGWKIAYLPYVPTAENLARWIWEELEPLVREYWRGNMQLDLVEVWETPTSLATYRG